MKEDQAVPVAENKTPAKGAAPSQRARQARRRVLRSILLGGGVLGVAIMGYYPVARPRHVRLRPPGALDEKDLLASCIKCGQCVQVCPVQAIKLADLDEGFGAGVPYIHPRSQACDFSCDAVQCILACPTGALTYHKPEFLPVRKGAVLAEKPVLIPKQHDPEPTLNLRERMGLARLAHPERCLAVDGKGFKGVARGPGFKGRMRYMAVDRWKPIPINTHHYEVEECDLCVRECPIKGAITIELVSMSDGVKKKAPVVHESCVGCGVCEMICPVEPGAIEIVAREGWTS